MGFYSEYADRDLFAKEFTKYNKEIGNLLVKDFIVFTGNKVTVRYRGALPGEAYKDFEFQVELSQEEGISFIDLMYQFNNGAYGNLEDVDHHFYEGLQYISSSNVLLVISMRLGS